MKSNFPLNVGDVIVSKKFAYGYYKIDNPEVIFVDGIDQKNPYVLYIDEEERVETAAKTGNKLPKWYVIDRSRHDGSRGIAEYLIVEAKMAGGGSQLGMNGHLETYPNALHITAKQLAPGRVYDPNGEVIEFYLDNIGIDNIKIVGKMEQIFV